MRIPTTPWQEEVWQWIAAVPWHRILRSSGELAFAADSPSWQRQQHLLAAEGIALEHGRVNMALYQWQP